VLSAKAVQLDADAQHAHHGRHCVFVLHFHLVFVTKYRKRIFYGDGIKRLRVIFLKACTDFEAELVEMNGEDNHEQPQGCFQQLRLERRDLAHR